MRLVTTMMTQLYSCSGSGLQGDPRMSDTTLARLRFHANICRMLLAMLLILGVVDIAIYSSSSCKHKGVEAHDCHSSNQVARAFRPVLVFHLLPVLPAVVLIAEYVRGI